MKWVVDSKNTKQQNISRVCQEVFAHDPLSKWTGGGGITTRVGELKIARKRTSHQETHRHCNHSPKGTSQLLTELPQERSRAICSCYTVKFLV